MGNALSGQTCTPLEFRYIWAMEVLSVTMKRMFSRPRIQRTLNMTQFYMLSTPMASIKDDFDTADAQEPQIMPSSFFDTISSQPVSVNLKLCSRLMSWITFTSTPWNARLQQEAFIANSEDSRQVYSQMMFL
jgi:hypothetical protein